MNHSKKIALGKVKLISMINMLKGKTRRIRRDIKRLERKVSYVSTREKLQKQEIKIM